MPERGSSELAYALLGDDVIVDDDRHVQERGALRPILQGGEVEIVAEAIGTEVSEVALGNGLSLDELVEAAYWNLYSAYYNLYAQEEGLRQSFEGYRYTEARVITGADAAGDA